MRKASLVLLAAVLVGLVGCQTRGVHTVPTARDYGQLERIAPADVAPLVAEAHRVGAQHFAPYEYFSAEAYLAKAKEERAENDRPAMWDYSNLAKDMAEAGIRKGGIPDKGPMAMPADHDAAIAEFERLKGRMEELDKDKAIQVAPVLYAHVVSSLSKAEEEIIEPRHYPQGVRYMSGVEADIDTIWVQDVDGDGIVDMKDGAPWAPEDKDNFEDEDGIPDPDNDQDGVLDLDDVMPNDPETKNRWHDYDGAPDQYPNLENLHFATGSATLSSDAKGYLRGITHIMDEWPELKLHLRGHTDNVASDEYNIKLSNRRAEATQKYLLGNGANAGQLVVTFHGEGEPVGDNKASKGRAANRRVELKLE
jgi:outer membrane protein OmpA-like peptidoglycan-associated protein